MKTKIDRISLYTYISIIFFSLIINFLMLYFTGDFIGNILVNVTKYFKFLYIQPFIIFSWKVFAELLFCNIFIVLAIEFVLISIFYRKLNKLFNIENLFTINKFIKFAMIIISIQGLLSIILWNIE